MSASRAIGQLKEFGDVGPRPIATDALRNCLCNKRVLRGGRAAIKDRLLAAKSTSTAAGPHTVSCRTIRRYYDMVSVRFRVRDIETHVH